MIIQYWEDSTGVTSKLVTEAEVAQGLDAIADHTQAWADRFLKSEGQLILLSEKLLALTEKNDKKNKSIGLAPAELARQLGYKHDYKTLPGMVKGRSRVSRLAQSLLMSSYLSWANSQEENKGLPRAGRKIMLGATDSQLVSMRVNEENIQVWLKAWDKEYELRFHKPSYVRERAVYSWSLPTIRYNQTKQAWSYDFMIRETVDARDPRDYKNTAGIDLGKVKPYQAVVVNHHGKVIAQYEASPRVKQLWDKVDKLTLELKHTRMRIGSYEARSIQNDKLERLIFSARCVKHKRSRLKAELARLQASVLITRLSHLNVSVIHVEDLTWVQGSTYGSKWNHSAQQAALKQAAHRQGITLKRVSARDTSQLCHACHSLLKHHPGRRVHCPACDKTTDRDVNASINIALDLNNYKKNTPHASSRGMGPTATLSSKSRYSETTKSKKNLSKPTVYKE
jgi:transposase